MSLRIVLPGDRPLRRVLCIGAHCDDIEIGCGGTLLALRDRHPDLAVTWLILSGTPDRVAESRAAATRLLPGTRAPDLYFEAFPDGLLPAHAPAVKARLAALPPDPDLVLTHWRQDAHQDHRLLGELAWQVFRRAAIWEYEIPKWDGDLGQPSVFVPLTASQRDLKVETLLASFISQKNKHWFNAGTFDALLRLRGIECASTSGFAEAFHVRKLIVAA